MEVFLFGAVEVRGCLRDVIDEQDVSPPCTLSHDDISRLRSTADWTFGDLIDFYGAALSGNRKSFFKRMQSGSSWESSWQVEGFFSPHELASLRHTALGDMWPCLYRALSQEDLLLRVSWGTVHVQLKVGDVAVAQGFEVEAREKGQDLLLTYCLSKGLRRSAKLDPKEAYESMVPTLGVSDDLEVRRLVGTPNDGVRVSCYPLQDVLTKETGRMEANMCGKWLVELRDRAKIRGTTFLFLYLRGSDPLDYQELVDSDDARISRLHELLVSTGFTLRASDQRWRPRAACFVLLSTNDVFHDAAKVHIRNFLRERVRVAPPNEVPALLEPQRAEPEPPRMRHGEHVLDSSVAPSMYSKYSHLPSLPHAIASLEDPTSVWRLSLANCGFHDQQDAQDMLAAVKQLPQLRQLDISLNNFESTHGRHMVNQLLLDNSISPELVVCAVGNKLTHGNDASQWLRFLHVKGVLQRFIFISKEEAKLKVHLGLQFLFKGIPGGLADAMQGHAKYYS